MKKFIISLLVTATTFFTLVFTIGIFTKNHDDEFKVAMVTDFSDVNDASFNQACYEGAKEWSKKYGIKFNYYKPASVSLAERVKSLTLAIDRGYKVILCPGFALGEPISIVAPKHPDVKFIGLDITKNDFPEGFELTDNIVVYNYEEEIAGYLAGYGVVKDGFRSLGFLGGMETAPVIKFGYGYLQGIDAATQELGVQTKVQYVYGGQFFGDSEIHAYIDGWYKSTDINMEIVFACGGSIYTSVALAAKENNGHMIGVDSDQAPIIDRDYGEGICVTSAMKGIKRTVIDKLELYYQDPEHFPDQGITYLGLESRDNPEENYVQLPLDTWRMDDFTIEDYKKLIGELLDGEKSVSPDIDHKPSLSEYTNCKYWGSIK